MSRITDELAFLVALQGMASLLPYAVLLTGLLLMSGLFKKNDGLERSVCIGLLGWTLLESVWTLVQTLRDGVETYRYPFIVSGSFYSPAPFGALLAIGLAVAAASIIGFGKRKRCSPDCSTHSPWRHCSRRRSPSSMPFSPSPLSRFLSCS